MTEEELRAEIQYQRYLGLRAVSEMTAAWRRELWPEPGTDPIANEDARRQFMRQLATEAYWGIGAAGPHRRVLFGGICS